MAITNNGVVNSLPDSMIPSGYTRPTVTTFDDHEWYQELTLTVDKATVENATAATTLANIINDETVGIEAQVDAILAAEFLNTATVTAYADLIALKSNIPASGASTSEFYTDAAVEYVATVRVYVKSVPA